MYKPDERGVGWTEESCEGSMNQSPEPFGWHFQFNEAHCQFFGLPIVSCIPAP